MATTPISSISGLASGIQWSDMIDQIIKVDTSRLLDPVTARVTATKARSDAWKGYQNVMTAVRDASKALANGTPFDKFLTNAADSATSGRTLLSATAGAGASPGAYRMEVLAMATAEKLGSSAFASTSADLGLSGSFLVAGKQVTVANGDSLATVRDKINAANTGASPSHVTASILTVSTGVNRLVLSNETTGAAGIEVTENGAGTVLASLGLVSSSLVANTTSSGAARSYGLSTVASTIAQALGVPMPSPSSFKVNGHVINVDLSQDSLTSIAAKINAAAGPSTASIATETVNGASVSRLIVSGAVAIDTGDTANSTKTLQQLGFLKNQRSGEVQTLGTASALTDSNTALAATSASKLVDVGAGIGDTLTFSGTRVDGTTANVSVVVGALTTLQDVINAVSASGTGFAVAGHGVTASIDGTGHLRIADTVVGDSKLTFSAANDLAGGGTLDFGATSVAVTGRAMQLAGPADAQVRIDGMLITRSSNSISDALSGVTLALQNAEAGSVIDVSVARDNDSVVGSVKVLANAFNAAAKYVSDKTAATGALPLDGSIRTTIASLRNALLGPVTGLTNTTYTSGAVVGLTFDKTGVMTLDDAALRAALASKPDEVKSLFLTSGTSALSTVQYMSSNANTLPGTYALAVTSVATTPVSTSAVVGAYANAATANQMVVTDSFTGHTSTVALANGDTAATIVSKLNTAFGADNLRVTASVTGGGAIQLAGPNYGSTSTIAVAFKLSGVAAAQQLGFAASVAGTDVVGTINGQAAAGAGQLLTASPPAAGLTNNANGLSVLFTGDSPASTTIAYRRGIGGAFSNASAPVVLAGTGTIALAMTSLQRTIDSLTARETDIQTRLDRQRESLTARFTAMETALSALQAQGQWLTGQINSLSGLNSSK